MLRKIILRLLHIQNSTIYWLFFLFATLVAWSRILEKYGTDLTDISNADIYIGRKLIVLIPLVMGIMAWKMVQNSLPSSLENDAC